MEPMSDDDVTYPGNGITIATSADPTTFLTRLKARKWIKWWQFPRNNVLLYFDSYNNVECYYPQSASGEEMNRILGAVPNIRKYKRVFIPVDDDMLGEDTPELKLARQCLFKVYDNPTIDMLLQMVAAVQEDIIQCDELKKKITPTINNVQLTIVQQLNLQEVRQQFFEIEPFNSNTTWMMWTRVTDQQMAAFLYKDQEKMELYYLPGSAAMKEKVQDQFGDESGIEFVELLYDPPFKDLQIARTCLFRHKKNSLDASLDELQDMIRRMKDLAKKGKQFKTDAAGIDAYFKQLYPTGNKDDAKGKAAKGWVWEVARHGGTPRVPKFYFNPKPVRIADESKRIVTTKSGKDLW